MMKYLVILALTTLYMVEAINSEQQPCIGCPITLTGDSLKEAEEVLIGAMGKVALGNGPTYILRRILSASKQIVSGTKYTIKASLNSGCNCSSQICDVNIILVPWLQNEDEVTIKCSNDPVAKKYSIKRNLKTDVGKP